MKILACMVALCGALMAASFATMRQSAANGPGEGEVSQNPARGENLWSGLAAFDKDGDGKLTRAEITDDRLLGFFDRADADKDGILTKAEVTAQETKEMAKGGGGRGGPGGGGGFGGPGGPGRGMPRPGEVLPMMARQNLKLSGDQEKQLDALQKDVDAKLAEILTDEQEKELKTMRERGPGGPGGGPGGPGGGRGGRPKGAPPRDN